MISIRSVLKVRTGCFTRPLEASRFERSKRCFVCRAKQKRDKAFSNRTEKTDTPEIESDSKPPEENDSQRSDGGKRMGWSFFEFDKTTADYEKTAEDEEDIEYLDIDLINPARENNGPLPKVTRDQVINSCYTVSVTIFAMGIFLRNYASKATQLLGNDPERVESLLSLTPAFQLDHIGIAIGAILIVSGMRFLLYKNWKEFAIATNRSNKQVLPSLSFSDLLTVSFIPGISEELLFRGGLIPSSFPDWKGVLIAGVVFGALHNSGGRNLAFALWAAAVGCLYGFAFLYTQDIYVPMAAHSIANLFAAMYWLSNYEELNA